MAVVIVLALLLSACGGGGTGLIQPQQINAPNDVERELIWRVWDAMGEPDYPVWVYRDTWTPGDDGRAWGDVGRGSNAPCLSKHGTELCAWAVTGRGRISVLQMTPETVDQFNAHYQPAVAVERCLFTLRRLAGLLIYERMHVLGYPYPLSDEQREQLQSIQPPPAALVADDERLAALRAFNERFNEWHGAWVAARERGCNSQPGTLQKSYPAPVKGSRSFRQFFRFSMLHHS